MIYLDNAATTVKKPEEVVTAVMNALNTLGNAGRGAHKASLDAGMSIFETRSLIAKFFNAENETRIAFTSNSTEALNTAIKGVITPPCHVISTVLEHNSVLRPLYEMQSRGVDITFAGCDEKGVLSYDEIEQSIKPETKAIITTHASNLTGNLVDIDKIGKIAKEHGLIYIVDASQTAGVYEIDVKASNIDILCFTGHKGLLGPQGTGGIYVREGITVRPLKSGGSGIRTYEKKHPDIMPTALEAGTLNGHGIAGLGAAIGYINKTGLKNIRDREIMLMKRFYDGVSTCPNVTIYGDFSTDRRCAVVSLNIKEMDSSEISDALFSLYGIATRPGAHCAPLMHKALGTVEQGAVRFSFSHFNTIEEVDAAVSAVKELADS